MLRKRAWSCTRVGGGESESGKEHRYGSEGGGCYTSDVVEMNCEIMEVASSFDCLGSWFYEDRSLQDDVKMRADERLRTFVQ